MFASSVSKGDIGRIIFPVGPERPLRLSALHGTEAKRRTHGHAELAGCSDGRRTIITGERTLALLVIAALPKSFPPKLILLHAEWLFEYKVTPVLCSAFMCFHSRYRRE